MDLKKYIMEHKGTLAWENLYSKKKISIIIVSFVWRLALIMDADNIYARQLESEPLSWLDFEPLN